MAEIRDFLPKRKRVIPSTNMITNIPAPDHLDKPLCHLQCFFKDPTMDNRKKVFLLSMDQRKKDRSEFEPDTMSGFQKTPASH